MLKCSGKWKIALFMGAVYAALMTVLLTGISYAKYREERMAYANFGAASFNAVILSADNTVDDMVDKTVNKFDVFEVFEEPLKMEISDYRPGMEYDGADPTKDTSKKIDFTIANGVNAENASEANIQYQIALRTTGHLPLEYSLLHKGTNQKLYAAGTEKVTIEPEKNIGTVWYEQRFYETLEGGQQREITFDLMGGALALQEYSLVVEWPIKEVGGVRTDDVRYMKEVELLQIFVTVSSKNMLEESDYGSDVDIEPEYGNGVVVLNANEGDKFVHYIDYRAFRKEEGEDETSYTLTIENGKDKNIPQRTTQTGYTVEIEVPWLVATEKTTATNTFIYSMQAESGPVELTPAGYRLYDELYNSAGYNTYTPITSFTDDELKAWSEVDSDKRLYKVFTFSGDTMQNTAHTAHEYQLILSGSGSAAISGKTSFEHKIKVLVTAEYTGTPIAGEGGEADG